VVGLPRTHLAFSQPGKQLTLRNLQADDYYLRAGYRCPYVLRFRKASPRPALQEGSGSEDE
jgi:hypothetical protein